MAGGVPLSRDRLIDELWGEQPPASAVSMRGPSPSMGAFLRDALRLFRGEPLCDVTAEGSVAG
jgi:hypothetical protein